MNHTIIRAGSFNCDTKAIFPKGNYESHVIVQYTILESQGRLHQNSGSKLVSSLSSYLPGCLSVCLSDCQSVFISVFLLVCLRLWKNV